MLTSVFLCKMNKGDDFFFLQNNHFICALLNLDPELEDITLIITGC